MGSHGQGRISTLLSHPIHFGANSAGIHYASGTHTTVDGNETVDTQLTEVQGVVVSLGSDPVAGCLIASGHISATAGSIDIKTWEGDATIATTFSRTVHWFAWGTR